MARTKQQPYVPAEFIITSISFKAAIPVKGKTQAEIDALIETLKASGWEFETGKVYVNKELYRGEKPCGQFTGYSVEVPAKAS